MKNFLRIAALLACLIVPSLAEAANRFAVCTATCTWDNASTAMWSTSTGGATGASVPASTDAVIFDGATCVGGTTCTITVAATINGTNTVTSLAMGACTASTTGCILDFSVNNPSIIFSATGATSFSITGTGTRTLKMGTGTFTVNGQNNFGWDATTTTNLTLTPGTSTILFTGSVGAATGAQTFAGGGKTYANLSIASRTNSTQVSITGANTFSNVLIAGPVTVLFPISVTTTITSAFTWAGSSSAALAVRSGAQGFPATISAASGSTIAWATVNDLTFTTSAVSATNSFDLQGNTMNGGTITAPALGGGRIIGG